MKRSYTTSDRTRGKPRNLVAGLAALAVVATGCGAAGTSNSAATPRARATQRTASSSIKNVAFAVNTMSAPQFVVLAHNFQKFGRQIGVQVKLYNNNGSGSTAISNAKLMVQSHPDAIVEFPPVAEATSRISQIFKTSGIPCISMNIPVQGCPYFNQSETRFASMMAHYLAGVMKKRGWTGGNTTIVIGQGSTFGPAVNIAVTAFYQDISRLVPGFKEVRAKDITPQTTTIARNGLQVDVGVVPDKAYHAFSQALRTIPRSRHLVVYAISDDSLVGIYRALVSQGRAKDAMMAGFGGDAHAVKGLRSNPTWVADSDGFITYWGEFLLAMAAAAQASTDFPRQTLPPMVILNKENVNQYFVPGSTDVKVMPPLPPVSRYLAKTGVLQRFHNVRDL